MILKDILNFAFLKHKGQTRIGNNMPYITHPIMVAAYLNDKGFSDPEYMAAAFCHDLLEDTDTTETEILNLSNEEVLDIVKCVTKEKGYVMTNYIEKIKSKEKAKMLKLADRLHNLRSALDADKKFRIKYIKETKDYYLDLAKGTVFEKDILIALEGLEISLELLP